PVAHLEEGLPHRRGQRVPRLRPPHTPRRREPPTPRRGQAPGGGARHPKKSDGVLRHPSELIFAWIEERRNQWPVALMCRALGVSRAGYYAWRLRQPSAAQKRREELTEEVKAVHAQVKGRYGSPRVHAELVARGHECCVNFVVKLMREAGIAAKTKRKFRQTTDSNHSLPVAQHVLDRQSDPAEPKAACGAAV